MATSVTVIGWHIHPEAAKCRDCGASASVFVERHLDGFPDDFDLCTSCMDSDRYEVVADKIREVFERAFSEGALIDVEVVRQEDLD